jgi:hypothetical protein
MSSWEESYKKEFEVIARERETYPSKLDDSVKKLFDVVSFCFLIAGFIALAAVFFTQITLVQATCFFVISFVVKPSDGDRMESLIKGMAQDLANIRISALMVSKKERNLKSKTE